MNYKTLHQLTKIIDGDSEYNIRYDKASKQYFVTAIWMTWQSDEEELEGVYSSFKAAMEKLIDMLKTNLENGSYDLGME